MPLQVGFTGDPAAASLLTRRFLYSDSSVDSASGHGGSTCDPETSWYPNREPRWASTIMDLMHRPTAVTSTFSYLRMWGLEGIINLSCASMFNKEIHEKWTVLTLSPRPSWDHRTRVEAAALPLLEASHLQRGGCWAEIQQNAGQYMYALEFI
jgi:hypothetical protein